MELVSLQEKEKKPEFKFSPTHSLSLSLAPLSQVRTQQEVAC